MTRLHKLLYLIDLEHFLEHGRTLTAAPWVREKYGPMTKAMLPSLRDMAEHEIAEVTVSTLKGRRLRLISPGPAPRFKPNLDRDQLQTVERVLRMTAHLSDDEVRAIAYRTTPMRYVAELERREGHELVDTPLEFGRMAEPRVVAEPDEAVDMEARSASQRDALAAFGPLIGRALSGSGR